MQIPAAMFIYSAAAAIKTIKTQGDAQGLVGLDAQHKELQSASGNLANEYNYKVDENFKKGYELGLQTARVMLLGSLPLAKAGIKPQDLL